MEIKHNIILLEHYRCRKTLKYLPPVPPLPQFYI